MRRPATRRAFALRGRPRRLCPLPSLHCCHREPARCKRAPEGSGPAARISPLPRCARRGRSSGASRRRWDPRIARAPCSGRADPPPSFVLAVVDLGLARSLPKVLASCAQQKQTGDVACSANE